MKIKRLELERFRQFKDTAFEFGDLNILAGANNSGKTSILWAIKTFFHFARKSLTAEGSNVVFHNHYIHSSDFMPIPNDVELWYKKDNRQTMPVRISIHFDNGWEGTLVLTARFGQIHVSFSSSPIPRTTTAQQIVSSFIKEVAFVPGLVGVLVQEPYSPPARQVSLASEGRYAEVFRSSIVHLNDGRSKGMHTLNEFLKESFGIELKPPVFDPKKDEYIRAFYKGHNGEFDIVNCGAGVQQIVQLFTYLYLKSPAVVLFDEPDAHLHPSVQTAFAAGLARIQKDLNAQLLVATHSYDIIDYFSRSSIILVDSIKRVNQALQTDQEKIEKLSQAGIIANSALIRLYSSRNCIILEDSSTEIFTGFDRSFKTKVAERHTLRSAKGVSKFGIQKEIVEAISGIIQHQITPKFVQDADGLPPAWLSEMQEWAKENKMELLFLSRHEIENYLIEPAMLKRILVAKGKTANLADIRKLIIETAEKSKYEWFQAIRDRAKAVNHILSSLPNRPSKTDVQAIAEVDAYLNQKPLSIEFVLSVFPGKELLRKIRTVITNKYGISFSNEELIAFADRRMNKEIFNFLKAL